MKLGNKIRKLVDQESIFKKPPSPKTLKKEKIAKLNIKQAHEKVKQVENQLITYNEDGEEEIELVKFPCIQANPKDAKI